MDDKTLTIVRAGWAMFARYGFAKTTMSDIATEAGVARQTVYNAFQSKESVLIAVVRYSGELSLAAIMTEWERDLSLEEKLNVFQEHGPLSWYKAIQSAPDWGELMDGVHKVAADELKTMEDKWVVAVEAMLRTFVQAAKSEAISPDEVARFFYTTSKNAKFGVTDIDELRARLNTITRATLALMQR